MVNQNHRAVRQIKSIFAICQKNCFGILFHSYSNYVRKSSQPLTVLELLYIWVWTDTGFKQLDTHYSIPNCIKNTHNSKPLVPQKLWKYICQYQISSHSKRPCYSNCLSVFCKKSNMVKRNHGKMKIMLSYFGYWIFENNSSIQYQTNTIFLWKF